MQSPKFLLSPAGLAVYRVYQDLCRTSFEMNIIGILNSYPVFVEKARMEYLTKIDTGFRNMSV
jgi:hypothetical protein